MKLIRSVIIPTRPTGRLKFRLRANHQDPRRPRPKKRSAKKKS